MILRVSTGTRCDSWVARSTASTESVDSRCETRYTLAPSLTWLPTSSWKNCLAIFEGMVRASRSWSPWSAALTAKQQCADVRPVATTQEGPLFAALGLARLLRSTLEGLCPRAHAGL